ncbi:MAG TPA: glycosyl hydrolase 53 family protein, partial [Bacteroidales bacterium]
ISQLYTDVWNHTVDVCNALKSAGVTPSWVQVGNETNNGMLWPDGQASTNMSQFAGLITSGYNGVKSVFSGAKVIVHLSNGYDNSLFRWMFDGLKTYGAKYDVIGMSLYPSTSNWSTLDAQCLTNMNDMKSRYGKAAMICEVGMAANAPSTCASFLKDIRSKNTSAGGLGVFYWEPEAYNWQGYGLGAWDASTKRPTSALIDGLKSAEVEQIIPTANNGNGISMYPNPLTSDELTVELNGLSGTTRIKILNVNGQELKTLTVINEQQVKINKSGLVPGIYFIQIDNPAQKIVNTLIVK